MHLISLAINIKLIHLMDSNVPDLIKFHEHHCKRLELIRLVVSADLHPEPLKNIILELLSLK